MRPAAATPRTARQTNDCRELKILFTKILKILHSTKTIFVFHNFAPNFNLFSLSIQIYVKLTLMIAILNGLSFGVFISLKRTN
jgi:hypothetical protein